MLETIKFVPNEIVAKNRDELISEGMRWICLNCGRCYRDKPKESYEDGHGIRLLEMCRCGSDLFKKLNEVEILVPKVEAVNGKLVFKEHHFKYCRCKKGEVWTGDATTECGATPEFRKKIGNNKLYYCPIGNMMILILKSTSQELTSPDERGSTYIRPIQ
jgi:hypothetical protein